MFRPPENHDFLKAAAPLRLDHVYSWNRIFSWLSGDSAWSDPREEPVHQAFVRRRSAIIDAATPAARISRTNVNK
jgi:hypothetical protein